MRRAMRPSRNLPALSRPVWFGLALCAAIATGVGTYVVAQDTQKAQMSAYAKAPLVPLQPQPKGVPFPTEAWPTGQAPEAAARVIKTQFDEAFSRSDSPMGQTRAVIIVQGGRVVAERYSTGFDEKSKLVSWSMAKSVTASLVGIAMLDQKRHLDLADVIA